MKNRTWKHLYKIIYIIIFLLSSLPLSCAYVMEGGDILIWLGRIEEVKENLSKGSFLMFPSAELTVARNGQISALYSNVWLLIPAMIRMAGGSITLAYRLYMLLLQALALFAAKKMFENLFSDENTVLMGVLLYMMSPYRLYVCYDKASLGMAAAWALIPLAVWGIADAVRLKAGWKGFIKHTAVTGLTLAAIGYADGMLLLFTLGVGVLGILWYRRPAGLAALAAGGILYIPGMIYFARYILKGGMEVWGLPLGSIASRGYSVGQFFSSWTYRENSPGLGLGLMIALIVLFWLAFTEGSLEIVKKYGYFVILLCVLGFMSMSSFPWDFVQRAGEPFLRLVPLMETPGMAFGFATLAASVLGAYGVECAGKQSHSFVRLGLPFMAALAAAGVWVYMCNTLTYSRIPMYLLDTLS